MGLFSPKVELSAEEQEFRKENQWHNFLGSLFNGIGVATFFGVVSQVVGEVLNPGSGEAVKEGVEEGVESAAGEAVEPTMFETTMDTLQQPAVAMPGLMAIGTASIYKAQAEYTESKALQDSHLAMRNAAAAQEKRELVEEVTDKMEEVVQSAAEAAEACKEQEPHAQNVRADGKSWQEVVSEKMSGALHLGA